MGVYAGIAQWWIDIDPARWYGIASGVVTNGLVLALDAGISRSYPGSGTTWTDLSGRGNNGTLTNGPTYSSDNGGVLDFDGTNDYASVAQNIIGTGNASHTLEMWVNFDVLTSGRWWLAVIGQYTGGSEHWIGSSPTSTQFGVWTGSQVTLDLLGINRWLHIVGTFNGTTLTYYVNNSVGGSTSATFSFSNSNLNIGLPLSGENYFNGKISNVRMYDRALTASEVSQNFNATRSRFGI